MKDSENLPRLPVRIAGTGRRCLSNLAPGLFFLNGQRRADAFLFHDFCRNVDDTADTTTLDGRAKQALLDAWFHALEPGREPDLPGDFLEMIQRRSLDRRLLQEIVRGMLMDVGAVRYATFPELERYCNRVASAVGLVSARIFGAGGPGVERYASSLGIALQLTNIVRDVAEDASLDRIYLPLEDLERFGVSQREILEGTPSPAMTHLLNHQAERADSWFAKAEIAWSELSVNQRRLMRPSRLMSAVYRELLLQMHRDRYDVLAKRYSVSGSRKLALLIRVMITGN